MSTPPRLHEWIKDRPDLDPEKVKQALANAGKSVHMQSNAEVDFLEAHFPKPGSSEVQTEEGTPQESDEKNEIPAADEMKNESPAENTTGDEKPGDQPENSPESQGSTAGEPSAAEVLAELKALRAQLAASDAKNEELQFEATQAREHAASAIKAAESVQDRVRQAEAALAKTGLTIEGVNADAVLGSPAAGGQLKNIYEVRIAPRTKKTGVAPGTFKAYGFDEADAIAAVVHANGLSEKMTNVGRFVKLIDKRTVERDRQVTAQDLRLLIN